MAELTKQLEDLGLIPDILHRYDSWYDASVGVPGDGSGGGETIDLTLDWDPSVPPGSGPNEIFIDGENWELPGFGEKGTGLDSLITVLNMYGAKTDKRTPNTPPTVSKQPAAPEQPEEMGMHNPFESRLNKALGVANRYKG